MPAYSLRNQKNSRTLIFCQAQIPMLMTVSPSITDFTRLTEAPLGTIG